MCDGSLKLGFYVQNYPCKQCLCLGAQEAGCVCVCHVFPCGALLSTGASSNCVVVICCALLLAAAHGSARRYAIS